MNKTKLIHPSDLPSTEEIIEPLRKLLDYLEQDRNGDWDQIPQYVALQKLLSQSPIAEVFHWAIELAIAEKEYGPRPQFKRAKHLRCDEFEQDIHELKNLAEKGGGHNDELRYQQARNNLLEVPEVAARAPTSLKAAISLRAFQEKINLTMGDCIDEAIKSCVIYDEFRHLSEWLNGDLVWGSSEWIADHAWSVKRHLMGTFNTMHTMGLIRDAVIAKVHPRASRVHWDQFIETEFSNEPFMAHALDIAQKTWESLFSRDAYFKRQTEAVSKEKDHPVKRKTPGRASRR